MDERCGMLSLLELVFSIVGAFIVVVIGAVLWHRYFGPDGDV
jgi:hypothetical protein